MTNLELTPNEVLLLQDLLRRSKRENQRLAEETKNPNTKADFQYNEFLSIELLKKLRK